MLKHYLDSLRKWLFHVIRSHENIKVSGKSQSPLYKECTECEPGDIYWRINELKTMQIIMVKTWVSMVKNVSNINMNVIILLDNLIEGKRLSYYGHFYCRNVLAFLKWHFLNIIWRFIKAKSRYFFDIFVVFCQLNS